MHLILSSIWIGLVAHLVGCGLSTTQEQVVAIEMYGVSQIPSGASGNASPNSYDMTFTGMYLTRADGTVAEFAPETVEVKTIVDRPQIIFSTDASEHEGTSFTSAQILFDASFTAGGKFEKAASMSLTQPTKSYVGDFSVATGKSLVFVVTLQWLNTVTRDTDASSEAFIEPSFQIAVDQ